MDENKMKEVVEKLWNTKKDGNRIETEQLLIQENTIYYSTDETRKTALQISNISQINVGPAPVIKVPWYSIALVLAGLILLTGKGGSSFVSGLFMILIGVAISALIVKVNSQAGDDLIIYLNNSKYVVFNFKDKAFLTEVFNVLVTCVNHKTMGKITINISNSTIESSSIGVNNITGGV